MTEKIRVDKGQSYTCAKCGGTFEADRTHDEAEKEYIDTFGIALDVLNNAVVCDDCWKEMGGK